MRAVAFSPRFPRYATTLPDMTPASARIAPTVAASKGAPYRIRGVCWACQPLRNVTTAGATAMRRACSQAGNGCRRLSSATTALSTAMSRDTTKVADVAAFTFVSMGAFAMRDRSFRSGGDGEAVPGGEQLQGLLAGD